MDKTASSRCLRVAVVVFACAAPVTLAQQRPGQLSGAYPNKPVRMIAGNAPGGAIDITARIVAQKLTERWGHSVVVDNRAGASVIIAMDLTAQAAPDGYTLMVTAGSLLASAAAQKKVSYDIQKAFAPVTQLTSAAYLLVVIPSVPVNSVKELIAYAKSKPGVLSYASSGTGSATHFSMELFKAMARVEMVHIPYKGTGAALNDLLGGQVHLMFANTISGMHPVRSGKLKALAVSSPRRARVLPDLPTISEAGVPGYEVTNWHGMYVPAKTPTAVIGALHREVTETLISSDVQARFANGGAEAVASGSPAEFHGVLAREVDKWEKLIKLPNFADSLR